MNAYERFLNDLLNEHKTFYQNWPGIKWINPYEAEALQVKRDKLLTNLNDAALFKKTKPAYGMLSEGCKLCGAGLWSCLFITGKCNAQCFYCPAPQLRDEPPTSQGMTFPTPEAYVEYVNLLNFKGVSFSGGEPLLVKDRVLSYLKAIRKGCNPELYVWMYTNGILASEEIFKELGEEGMNEVRFDIGATGYTLDKVAMAIPYIPKVTVEIPAVPEETERIKQLLPQLEQMGVKHLNLHQMRLTPHNVSKLHKLNYTYVAAERPVVLESELAALEIVNFAQQQQVAIGINYCSFHFKFRFQKAGYRMQLAKHFASPHEAITEKGFIRSVMNDEMTYQGYLLANRGDLNGSVEKLELQHKTYDLQRATACKMPARPALSILSSGWNHQPPISELAFLLWQHEHIESGLRNY